MEKDLCPHCYPAKRTTHWPNHLDYYLELLTLSYRRVGELFRRTPRKTARIDRWWGHLLEVLSASGVVRFIADPDRSQLYGRSLLFFDEAKQQGIEIEAITLFGKYINEFRFRYDIRWYYFEGIPLLIRRPNEELDDKHLVKHRLAKEDLPIARGRKVHTYAAGLDFASTYGYPLVVKPANGSLSAHVTRNIQNKDQLRKAIKIVKEFRPDYLIETQIEGNLYRATVIGQNEVFVCQKERANIVGNGKQTVAELIAEKNTHPQRGETGDRSSSLHKISIDDVLQAELDLQGLTLQDIPLADRKVYLQQKYVLNAGCDVIGLTDLVHADNRELFGTVAKLFNSDLVGIDFIVPDITKSYREQQSAILELNSLPYIDMHAFPSHGEADPVAKNVWAAVLKSL